MNEPEYIIVDEIREVVASTSVALTANDAATFPNPINYQHGYITELNETLRQWESDPNKYNLKFPLVWLAKPFTVKRGEANFYGSLNGVKLFIITSSDKNYKDSERESNSYNPILRPIYRELIKQFMLSTVFDMGKMGEPLHSVTDRPYWGESQQSVLNDIVDVLEISGLDLKINDNNNCG